ncbi:hypothetical protein ACWEP5_36565 [Nocardia niigatensis]
MTQTARGPHPVRAQAMPAHLVTEWGQPLWQALRGGRDFEHGAYSRCPTSWDAAEAMLRSRIPAGHCEGCLDLLTDALTHAWRQRDKVAAAKNPPAFLTRLARNRWKDLIRARNTARHGVACPERLDKRTAGRVAAALNDPWLVTLLQLMLADACSRGPVPASGWSLDRFAEEKQQFQSQAGDGSDHSPDPVAVRDDVATVLATARRVAGAGWVHDVFEAPRLLRRSEHTPLRVGATFDDDHEGTTVDIPSPDRADDIQLDSLTEAFFGALRHGRSAIDAARVAAHRLVPEVDATAEIDASLLTATVVGWLADLLADEADPQQPWTPQSVKAHLAARFSPHAVDTALAQRISRALGGAVATATTPR